MRRFILGLTTDLPRPSKRSRVYLVTDSRNVSNSQGLGLGLGSLNQRRTFAMCSAEQVAN